MKRFLVILVLILTSSFAFAEDVIVLETDSLSSKVAEQLDDDEDSPFFESGVTEEQKPQHSDFYNKVVDIAHNIYELQVEDTNAIPCLLEEPLTHHFEKGPIESTHLWAATNLRFTENIQQSGENHTLFNVGLINVVLDTKFKGGKEAFRIMLDPTPQDKRPFLQPFIQDLYFESKRIPHHTIMIGNSRPGVLHEGAQSPYTLPLVSRSQIARNFGNVRKFGIRLKGNYSFVDYDLGGYSSDTFFTEFFPGVEFDGWVNLKPLAKTNGKYGKLVTGGGLVSGTRNGIPFFSTGAYVGYDYKNFWLKAEYATADGSNGGDGLTKKQRQGWYVTVGYKITKKLEAILRYDDFDPDKNISNNNQREYTAGINYYIKGQALRLFLNYVFCQNQAKQDSHRIIIGTQIII